MQAENNISKLLTKEGILAYLQNKLSKEEKALFEKQMQQDEFLKDAVEGYKLLPPDELQKYVYAVFADVDLLSGAGKKSKLISMQTRPIAIAAMLLLFIGVVWFAVWFMKNSAEEQQIAQAEKMYNERDVQQPEEPGSVSAERNFSNPGTENSTVIEHDVLSPKDKFRDQKHPSANDDFRKDKEPLVNEGLSETKALKNISVAEEPIVEFYNEEIPATVNEAESNGYESKTQTVKSAEVINSDENVKQSKKNKSEKTKSDAGYTEDTDDAMSGAPAELAAAESDSVHVVVEQMPEYVGGNAAMLKFIQNNFHIPAGKEGYSGKVYVKFVIEETGKVSDIEIARSLEPEIDKEAVRVISMMPDWIPGKQNGKNVKVSYTLPISLD